MPGAGAVGDPAAERRVSHQPGEPARVRRVAPKGRRVAPATGGSGHRL